MEIEAARISLATLFRNYIGCKTDMFTGWTRARVTFASPTDLLKRQWIGR